VATLLTNLTSESQPGQWTTSEDGAFRELISRITSAPTLLLPDPAKPYVLHTDASGNAAGAVLQQLGPTGVLQPVAFMSKRHSDAEANYATHELETLAIIRALGTWRHLLMGTHFVVFTDHRALEYLRTQPTRSFVPSAPGVTC